MEDKTTKVLEILKLTDKPLKQGEIAEMAGIDSKEIAKIIDLLKKDGKIESPKRCFYSIKK